MTLPLINKKEVYFIDLFCGAGGTSTGMHLAGAKVLACVNHDTNAIKSHEENHPNTKHYIEDIRDFQVVLDIKKIVDKVRKKNPNSIIALWASLECTNFSNAKGGLPKNPDSRSLAEHMFMYLSHIDPDIFLVENVREFQSWGPLDNENMPIKEKKGIYYNKWVQQIKRFGYDYNSALLNSADFGAYQSRKRLFLKFCKKGFEFDFPESTHCKKGLSKPKWNAVKHVLNLDDKGGSIFGRKRPYAESTLKRIYMGLEKFVSTGDANTFMQSYYGNGQAHSINNPCGTLTTKDRYSVIFIDQQYGNSKPKSIEEPCNSLTTVPKFNIVEAEFLLNPQYGCKGKSINEPCFTLIASMHKSPPYIVSTSQGSVPEIEEGDSDTMKKIKIFMKFHGINDIKMRLLNIPELKRIQGFPSDYILKGTQTEQKRYIGNAVEVNQSKAIIKSLIDTHL